MIIIFILFIISLATLVGLLISQKSLVRKGTATLGQVDAELENPLSESNLTLYKNTVSSWIEARTRKSVLYALRFSIKIGYFVKSKLDAIVSGVHRKAAKHERNLKQEERKEDTTGTFLNTIGEYKDKITKKSRKKSE
jgi:hypothetical protein